MSNFRVDITDALKKMGEAQTKILAGLELYGKTAAAKMERDAKARAPWTDRTAQARQTIDSGVSWKGKKLVLRVSGHTSYFPHLEEDHKKLYAILWPTVNRHQDEIIRGFAAATKR